MSNAGRSGKGRGGGLLLIVVIVVAALFTVAVFLHGRGPTPMQDFVNHLVDGLGFNGHDRIEITDERGHLEVTLDDGRILSVRLDGQPVPDERMDLSDDVLTVTAVDGAVLFKVPLTKEAGWLLEMPPGAVREEWLAAKRAEAAAERSHRSAEEEHALDAIDRSNDLLAAEIARRLDPALEAALASAPAAAPAAAPTAAPAAGATGSGPLDEAQRRELALRAASEAVSDLSRDMNVRLPPDGSVWLSIELSTRELSKELTRLVPRELTRADIALSDAAREELDRALRQVAQDLEEVELMAEPPGSLPQGAPADGDTPPAVSVSEDR